MNQSTRLGTIREVLLLLLLVSLLSGYPEETFGQARTFQITVASGQQAKLAQAVNIDQNCKKMATPEVQILVPPSNGSATARKGQFTVRGPRRFIEVNCPERVLPGVGVYYKSRPGFRGTDQVSYRLHYDIDGKGRRTWDETAVITVQ